MSNTLKDISKNILTQDNQCTSQPLFVVFQKRRIYGIDPSLIEEVVWVDLEGYEANEDELKQIQEIYNDSFDEPDGWIRTGYIDIDVFVTACFTEVGAKKYIERNGHNLKNPFIYVETLYRNEEMNLVRESVKRIDKIQNYFGEDLIDISEFIGHEFNRLNPDKLTQEQLEIYKMGVREGLRYFEQAIDLEKGELIKTTEDTIKMYENNKDFYKRRTDRLNEWFRSDELKDTKIAYEWFSIQANGHLITDGLSNKK